MEATENGVPGVMPRPPGVTATSETMVHRLILTCALCPCFAVPIVALRLYTARCVVRRIYPDDWLVIVSLLFAIGYSIFDIIQTENGLGHHLWNVTPAQFERFNIVGIPASLFYNLCTLFVKASILFFYLRFAAANQPFRIFAYIMLLVVIGYSLASGLMFLYLCVPMRKYWDYSVEGGYCLDSYAAFLTAAAMNSVTDVILLILPMWLLWPLRVRLRKKIAVGLVLMPGGFVCFVSFYRLLAIPQGLNDPDTTWRYCINQIWCLIEMYVGIICASLPCLKAFTKHHFPGAFDIMPDRPSHERVNFSVVSAIPVQLRTWTSRRREIQPAIRKGSELSALSEAGTGAGSRHGSGCGVGGERLDGKKEPQSRIESMV